MLWRRTLAHDMPALGGIPQSLHLPCAMTICSPNTTHVIAESVCPLCGQANQCAIAAGQPAEGCWCMAPGSVAPEALALLPPEQQGKACICPTCGSRGGAPSPLPAQPAPL